jgi:hypothetical protein
MATSQATRQAMWLSSVFGSISAPQMKPIIIYETIKVVYLYKKTQYFILA